MHYIYTKKNNLFLSFLLFLSCAQPVHASEQISLFFNNQLNIESLKKNKLYIGGALLLGAIVLYLRNRSNSNQNPKPKNGSANKPEQKNNNFTPVDNLKDSKNSIIDVSRDTQTPTVLLQIPAEKEDVSDEDSGMGEEYTPLDQVEDEEEPKKKPVGIIIQNPIQTFGDKNNPFTSIEKIQKKVTDLTDEQCNGINRELIQNFNSAAPENWGNSEQFKDLDCCPEKFLSQQSFDTYIKVAQQAAGAYVFCIAQLIDFIPSFLDYKNNYGTKTEQAFYAKSRFTPFTFIQRLLSCRPMVFINSTDETVLSKDDIGVGGTRHPSAKLQDGKNFFEQLPDDPENIKKYITYDEMYIGSLLAIHSNTFAVNQGDRRNDGILGDLNSYENQVAGSTNLVGVRLEKASKDDGTPGFMGWPWFLVVKNQNTPQNGYGCVKSTKTEDQKAVAWVTMWEKFYGVEFFPTYEEVESNKIKKTFFVDLKNKDDQDDEEILYFNTIVYQRHMYIILLGYFLSLFEKHKNTKAQVYVSTVGLGIGMWSIVKKDGKTFAPEAISMSTFLGKQQIDIYMQLLTKHESFFENISDIDFAFFAYSKPDNTRDINYTNEQYNIFEEILGKSFHSVHDTCHRKYKKQLVNKNIIIHLSERPPFAKLTGEDEGKLIETIYAGDSGSWAGNEGWVWLRMKNSGEAAAFGSSLIATHHNIYINTFLLNNIVVLQASEV